ncbi:MAG: hypothetical protein H6822_25550 [Planctomycetaceae bacterium]|nr:hypothetical protein [Planctomycetaceae bacterium]
MTSPHDKPKQQRRWQFRISSLLLITALVATAVGWWLDRQQLIVEINAAEAAAKQREALHVAELARKQNEAFEIQMDLRRKTAEADVYIQTIAELAEKLKAE